MRKWKTEKSSKIPDGTGDSWEPFLKAADAAGKRKALKRNLEDFPKALDFFAGCDMIVIKTNKKF